MIKENEILKNVDSSLFIGDEDTLFNNCIVEKFSIVGIMGNSEIIFKNCIIDRLGILDIIYRKVYIENCVINDLVAWGTYFKGGLSLKNCIIKKTATFEAGGHNDEEVIIENNVFMCQLDFFDTQFRSTFIFRNNILLAGTDLLGNKDKVYKTVLGSDYTIENNIGNLESNT